MEEAQGGFGILPTRSPADDRMWFLLTREGATYEAIKAGEMNRAVALQSRLTHYMHRFDGTQPIARAKYLLQLRGFDVGPPRPPHAPLSGDQRKTIENVLREMRSDPLFSMEG